MSYNMVLVCSDCSSEFVWTEGEQNYYSARGMTTPKRCKPCRENRKTQRAAMEAVRQRSEKNRVARRG